MLLCLAFFDAKPYRVLPPLTEPGRAVVGASLERDVLTFVANAASPKLLLQGGVNEPMARIEGSDQWTLRVQRPDWDRAFFSYGFVANPNLWARSGEWRGVHAPAKPERAGTLKGSLRTETLYSPALKESRKLFVYLPPVKGKGAMPAFYATDGEQTERFAKILEPLILAGRVRPCAIVGVDHGGYRGDLAMAPYDARLNFRTREYVPGVDPERFGLHRRFFTEEARAFAQKRFRLSGKREDMAAMGYSDGAVCLASVASSKPTLYGSVLLMSMYSPFKGRFTKDAPRFFLSAGRLEAPLDRYASDLYRSLDPKRASLSLYVAAHEPDQWELALATVAPKVFPPSE